MHVINAGSEEREERRMGATAQLMSDFQMSRVPRSQSRLRRRGCHRPDHPPEGEPPGLRLLRAAGGQTPGPTRREGQVLRRERGAGGGGAVRRGCGHSQAPPRPGTWYAPGPTRSPPHPAPSRTPLLPASCPEGASWRAVPEPQEPRKRDQPSEAH